ncbi:hypothetical protein [Photorhabdus khanii]|nr:hypothetical protein [Photorhabdus khanii]
MGNRLRKGAVVYRLKINLTVRTGQFGMLMGGDFAGFIGAVIPA